MSENGKIITRFAPSPTGYLHIGGARTALFNFLYTRKHSGTFILRIEDTDQLRSTDESTRAILDSMTWLGLNWDKGPFFQTERLEAYRETAHKMVAQGKAYHCVCQPEELEKKRKRALAEGRKPKYDGTCRDKNLPATPDAVIRFRCPGIGATVVRDMIKGAVTFNNEEMDDLVIIRQDGHPTYNFAVVVDDSEMAITDVIRGDDHLNNTPRQILLYEALGYAVPRFAHVPMILGADKARLSKRHGATSVMAYREMGYLPEALVNYLVRLGWSHGDQEIFSMPELIELFNFEAVGKAPAVFNPEKLLWLNQHYIKECPAEKLAELATPFWKEMGLDVTDRRLAAQVVSDLRERAKTIKEMAAGSAFYFMSDVAFDEAAVKKFLSGDHIATAEASGAMFAALADENYTKEGIESALRDFAARTGKKLKDIAQPLRVALTGTMVSPPLDSVMTTLGKQKVLERIGKAVEHAKRAGQA